MEHDIYKQLSERYDSLEHDILDALRNEINNSDIESEHISYCKAIKVNVFDYTEMVIWNDEFIFLDNNGYHYSLWAEVQLEDLIDILNKINQDRYSKLNQDD